jgi:hypothetical protein
MFKVEWNAAALANQTAKFSVKIIKGGNMMIGLAPKSINLEGSNYNTCGWYLYTSVGSLYSWKGEWNIPYVGEVCDKEGTIVGVEWKKKKGELYFWINGKCMGLAFSGVLGDLYPAFDFFSSQVEIELLDEA